MTQLIYFVDRDIHIDIYCVIFQWLVSEGMLQVNMTSQMTAPLLIASTFEALHASFHTKLHRAHLLCWSIKYIARNE